MSNAAVSAASSGAEPSAPPLVPAIEAALKLRLADQRFWLLSACGLFVTLMLTLVQVRTQAFDTLQLMSRLMLAVEVTLLLTAMLMAGDTANAARVVGLPRRWLSFGLSGGILLSIQLAVQLLLLLFLHQYPELVEQSIRVPVMLLQRGLLLVLLILAAYHVMLGLLLQLRLPSWLVLPGVLALYAAGSRAITELSLKVDAFKRLNDLFYWNQLWHHLPDFPRLETEYWTHNMEANWLGYYLLLAGGLALLTLFLWLPAALLRDARETMSRPS